MKTLRDLGEDAVVERLTGLLSPGAGVLVGPGDDCAVLQGAARGKVALLKTDCLVEGVHYTPDAPPAKVGWKAVARVVSDFAAMGGTPDHLVVTLALPPARPIRWVEGIYRGMDRCAREFGAAVVGGETSSLPPQGAAVISVAATGWAWRKQLALRSGGKAGDILFVTGRLGGSRRGRHLDFTPRVAEAAWLTAHFPVHAMMDVSDGLGRDLPRLAEASGCGFRVDRGALPRHRGVSVAQAIGDGEDYELLFAVSGRTAGRVEAAWKKRRGTVGLTRIGALTAPGDGDGLAGGWEHFR
ncbi:MAG: thiamine-monophosphate kinase [Akkermansiaceae bacterium]|nr:thiamine-monophosphate kinase [Akkermansiaceae bacterium]